MIFRTVKALREKGILGMNARNLNYVVPENDRDRIRLVDDKLQTKQLAKTVGIATPELYGVISSQAECDDFLKIVQDHSDFVIKPASGTGGKGIVIIIDKIRDRYRKGNDVILTYEQIQQHISKLLTGVFSLGGFPDKAIIEYRVKSTPVFDKISYHGVPDVRVVVYRGYPVMAMLRLPTISSDGKANLHQGAIGVGINIATGLTTQGVMHNNQTDEHPDTLNPIDNVQIPEWDAILNIATRCYELTGLGYIGVDIVIDKDKGPLLLEMNARPGLNIQIANQDGLGRRIALLEPVLMAHPAASVDERIATIKHLFA